MSQVFLLRFYIQLLVCYIFSCTFVSIWRVVFLIFSGKTSLHPFIITSTRRRWCCKHLLVLLQRTDSKNSRRWTRSKLWLLFKRAKWLLTILVKVFQRGRRGWDIYFWRRRIWKDYQSKFLMESAKGIESNFVNAGRGENWEG